MKKVSIIVPIYNVEKYLEKCLISLINQTLKEIEIILINDKSPDHCDEIMERYKKQYPDKIITVYLPTNQKQGAARNAGIKMAKGEYLLFVDSDDWVDETMCEKLYNAAKLEDAEISYCDYSYVWEGEGRFRYIMDVIPQQAGVLTKQKKKSLFTITAFPFAKLVQRRLILENRILFAEELKYEDKVAVPFFHLYASKMAKVNEALYYYNQRENSTVSSKNEEFQFDRIKATKLFCEEMNSRGLYQEYREETDMCYIRECYLTMLYVCLERFDTPPIDKMEFLRLEIQKEFPEYKKNTYINQIVDPLYLKIAECNDISSTYLVERYKSEPNFFKDVSFIEYYKQHNKKCEQMLQSLHQENKNIAIWGAGAKGEDFLQVCDRENKWIHFVIDSNKKKEGTLLPTGHVIQKFETVENSVDVILVVNRYHYGEIYKKITSNLSNRTIKVINLDMYLVFDLM